MTDRDGLRERERERERVCESERERERERCQWNKHVLMIMMVIYERYVLHQYILYVDKINYIYS